MYFLFAKRSYKSACENLQCWTCKICNLLFAANIAVEQVIVAAITIMFSDLKSSDVH